MSKRHLSWSIGIVLLATTAPAWGQGAEKYPLIGPDANVLCAGEHQPVDSAGSEDPVGFVVFNLPANGTVTAVVSLKKVAPNADYPVRLIQTNGDCHTVDGVITTNNRGNGTLRLAEPVDPTATAAQVIVDTAALHQTPSYRATDSFVY